MQNFKLWNGPSVFCFSKSILISIRQEWVILISIVLIENCKITQVWGTYHVNKQINKAPFKLQPLSCLPESTGLSVQLRGQHSEGLCLHFPQQIIHMVLGSVVAVFISQRQMSVLQMCVSTGTPLAEQYLSPNGKPPSRRAVSPLRISSLCGHPLPEVGLGLERWLKGWGTCLLLWQAL